MSKRKTLAGVAVIVVLAGLAVVWALLPRTQDKGADRGQSVDIATNLPLTGNLATYGKSIRRGAQLARKDLQESDSDVSLDFKWDDNQGSPQTAVTLMKRQLLNDPDIYVSGVRPQTMAIWEKLSREKIPHFVWIFELFVNKQTPNKNNFRTWVNLKIEPNVFLDFAKRNNAEKVAIAYVNLPSSRDEFNKLVLPKLKDLGISGDNLLVEPYGPDRSDFGSLADKFEDFDPDTIILNGFQGNLVGLVRALRGVELLQETDTIASYDMLDAAKVLAPEEVENIAVVAPEFVTRPEKGQRDDWRNRFRKEYDTKPLYTAAYAYDMTRIIADAAERLDLPADNEAWIRALRKTDIQGVTGRLRFDDDQSLITPIEAGVFRDGEVRPLNVE